MTESQPFFVTLSFTFRRGNLPSALKSLDVILDAVRQLPAEMDTLCVAEKHEGA